MSNWDLEGISFGQNPKYNTHINLSYLFDSQSLIPSAFQYRSYRLFMPRKVSLPTVQHNWLTINVQ